MNRTKLWLSPRLLSLGWLLLLLPVLTPLLRPGFFISDDGRFHVYRIAALADAWREGVLHPRLFPDFGFGYGQAVLNYYSPLSYWPGALLSLLGMSPTVAFQWTVGLGFVLAALAAYAYARSLWGQTAGVLAALVYSYLPYHLADAYTRGALPEHFAFIFPPLILWAYTALFRADSRAGYLFSYPTLPLPIPGRKLDRLLPQDGGGWEGVNSDRTGERFAPGILLPLLWGSLAWAGLVLTHNLTTLLMALAAIPHLLLLTLWSRRWDRLLWAALSLLLAMGISAGYWLPVLAESGAVGIGGGPSQGFVNHLLALPDLLARGILYPYRDANGLGLVYPLSWLTPLLLIGGLAAFFAQRTQGVERAALAYHLALALGAIAMTTTATLFLWLPLTPLLGHLQYPWRFLVLEALGLMICAAWLPRLLPRLPGWLWALGLTGLLAIFSLPGLPDLPLHLPADDLWSPQRMWQEDAETGQVGATWTGEFVPVTVTEQRWALGRPRDGAADGPALTPGPTVQISSLGHSRMEVAVESAIPFDLRLHQFTPPGWNAALDGAPVAVAATGEMGLVTASVPAGSHQITFAFGPTLARRLGAALGLLAVALWVLLVWRAGRSGAAGLLAALALLLALNGLGIGAQARTPIPAQARLGDTALLIGYESSPARGERALDVTLYWFALRDTSANLNVFVHLLGGDGGVAGQHDGAPVGGFTPTSRWRAGEIIADTHRIPLPPEIGPGVYGLKAGLYDPATVTNLPVSPPTPDNRVELGQVDVGW
ncbi:MAG: hypothetical protein KJZ86_10510 [Caldilineaceae bacterium]|nr:hypothetical protein [Caldilineaceae bacterium]